MVGDLRYGIRMLAKRPGFTATAVATLALGIGANSAIFSVVNALLLQPLPFAESERLFALWAPRPGEARGSLSHPDFADYRSQNTTLEGVAAFRTKGHTLSTRAGAERIAGARAAAGFFELLRVTPRLGRSFSADEDRIGAPRVAVLADGLWRRRFDADPAMVGRTITLDNQSYSVVGVLPAGFRFDFDAADAEVWTALGQDDPESQAERGMHSLRALARLRPGVSEAAAQADLAAVSARLAQAYPDHSSGRVARLVPLQEELVGGVRQGLLVLLGAVGCVLLIACANVANLLLARAGERTREVAVRSALGADRWRLARQLVSEALLLALLGGASGLLLAHLGKDALLALAPADLPRSSEVALDLRVVGFTLGLSLLTGLLFGSVPALRASRVDLVHALAAGGRAGGPDRARQRFRGALIVAEVALSLVLLVGAGLMLRSLAQLDRVDPGLDPHDVLTAQVSLSEVEYASASQVAAFYQRLLPRLQALPGVSGAAGVMPMPFGTSTWSTWFQRLDRPAPPRPERQGARYAAATPGYFETLRIPLRRGRTLRADDTAGRPLAVVINESLARVAFPGEDPLGKRVSFGISMDEPEDTPWEIVGVVGDSAHERLDGPTGPAFFVSAWQHSWTSMSLVVRTADAATTLPESLRKLVREQDPGVPVSRIAALPELLRRSVAARRFQALLLSLFAGIALLLAAVGLYGVMALAVSQRTREIGIRMALGAPRQRVVGLIVRHGMALAGAGVAVGLLGALAITHVLSSLLFGVSPSDPATFAGVALVLGTTAFVACWLPARRATRVDPLSALRCE